jgi:multidrug resistance efflux pump
MPQATQDIEIRSEEVQEILTAVPSWMIRWGNTLVLLCILGILAISWFVSYPDIIPSQAIVTTEIPPQKIFARSTGSIDTLLVQDNQNVLANTPLAIIENAANYKDVFYLKNIVDTIKQRRGQFQFPIEQIPILFLGEIETQYAAFEIVYQEYVLNKKLKPFSNEAIANSISISEQRFRLQTLKAKKELSSSELVLAKANRDRKKLLFEKGVIAQQEFESAQSSYLRAENTHTSNDATISQTLESIANANRTAKGTNINSVKTEITNLKKVHQAFNRLKTAIKNWELKYALTSQIDGKATLLNFWSTHQNVNPNDLMFTIIPKDYSAYIAKLKMPAQNSGKVKTGQKVQLRLQDFPDNQYGMLEGTIARISAVTDQEGFYLIDVHLPKTLITSYNKTIPFKQEMKANAEIITEDLRLIERFFYQFRNIFKK